MIYFDYSISAIDSRGLSNNYITAIWEQIIGWECGLLKGKSGTIDGYSLVGSLVVRLLGGLVRW